MEVDGYIIVYAVDSLALKKHFYTPRRLPGVKSQTCSRMSYAKRAGLLAESMHLRFVVNFSNLIRSNHPISDTVSRIRGCKSGTGRTYLRRRGRLCQVCGEF